MTIEAYEPVVSLWRSADGVGLSQSDTREAISIFLDRNPGFSFVARDGESVIGAILCGHDGRRGYIYHLAVDEANRRRGVGRALVEQSLSALSWAGIDKCHLFVFNSNKTGQRFWQESGWTERDELTVFSIEGKPDGD
ncbi:MAG: GNAT family N-acetyltransferase [Anaerolineae bacterium]|nr:GNAT family N-acetyltransferase [Anaerolineae bacterium]